MRATVYVYKEKLRHNLRTLTDLSYDRSLIAVVKANAYGLGAIGVSKAIEAEEKLSAFAVTTADEALELRKAGIKKPILILLPILPNRIKEIIENDITPSVHNIENLKDISDFLITVGKTADVHLKIDTGMNRWGIKSEELNDFINFYKQISNVNIKGLYSHISDKNSAPFQIDRFDRTIEKLKENGIEPEIVHISSSSTVMQGLRSEYATDIRIGLALYGVDPFDLSLKLEPSFEFTSYILMIKHIRKGETVGYNGTWSTPVDTTVAIIPIGYEDGIIRALSNKASVLINQKRAFLVGTVSMDAIIVNINGIDAELYDKVTIIGKNGEKSITAWNLAKLAGTIPYEIMTGIGSRVERIYI
ncbi:MAG: alanine racemase [Epsilonproteobacteria bacterium]|nr:alanine racemase [Campylobacterota bacterium]